MIDEYPHKAGVLGPCWECGVIYETRYGSFRANIPYPGVPNLNFCSQKCGQKHPPEHKQAVIV